MANRLQHSSSAYLVQHANNPVDWWPWGDEAFAEAKRADKPIFLSVGYAACHWCHVMAHESFENEAIAALLNESFISIKVDREERPDVDAIYMAATQLMSGHGGWPMSVFLTPEMKPFLAGTYFPPTDRGGQPGFTKVVSALAEAWRTERPRIEEQAEELAKAIRQEVNFIDRIAPSRLMPELATVREKLRDQLSERYHRGGYSVAPKFPRASFVNALLDLEDDRSREMALGSLQAMSHGGLYDHIDGGFARYSVDEAWDVPHFEKMLCDQALLAKLYLRAGKRFHNEEFTSVGIATIDFVMRAMAVDKGFASSLDADANGVEGSHITWTPSEVEVALVNAGMAEHLDEVLSRWSITTEGNLEGRSVPKISGTGPFITPSSLSGAARALRQHRAGRPQPGRDEKVILEWNAMFAGALLSSPLSSHREAGLSLLLHLLESHQEKGWWRTETHVARATLADLAWLVDSLISAFEMTGEDSWLREARNIIDYVRGHFRALDSDGQLRGYYSQDEIVSDIPTRTKDLFDGAVPAAHSVWTRALSRYALVTGDGELLGEARDLVLLAASVIENYPLEVIDLVEAAGYAFEGIEIVIPGDENPLSAHLRLTPMIRSVLITGNGSSPLLTGRQAGLAYVCRDGVCTMPVDSWADLDSRIAELTFS